MNWLKKKNRYDKWNEFFFRGTGFGTERGAEQDPFKKKNFPNTDHIMTV